MKWQVKSAIRRAVLALPEGERLYRWLTAEVMGTMAGMAAKWFRVLPAHVAVLHALFGEDARRQRLWCFDSGATIAVGLAMAVGTDLPGLLTDGRDRLSSRYCGVSRRLLRAKGPELAELSGAPAGRVAELLAASAHKDALAALHEMRMTYAATHAAAERLEWRGEIGCVFSAGALEHYEPERLEGEVARMARALRPGGVMSHVVDHRDHRWHADKRISPLLHLTLDDEEYRRFRNPLDYHNRWLCSRYADLFARYGFRVESREAIGYADDLPPLDRPALAGPFRHASAEDLHSLVRHFIAFRR